METAVIEVCGKKENSVRDFERLPRVIIEIPEGIKKFKRETIMGFAKPCRDYIPASYQMFFRIRGEEVRVGLLSNDEYRMLVNSPVTRGLNIEVEMKTSSGVQKFFGDMLYALCVLPC
jgi:hypothetical protein